MQALTTARSPHRYVEGFEYYAARRHGASSLDLTLWSILNGSCEGAYQLWTLSTAPLRLSLLGQEVCRRKLDEGVPPRKASELQELLDRLKDGAAGILDYVESQEDARMVLCSVDGPYAVLGSSGSEGLSILDLAIQMANLHVVGHRHSQGILDERWMGRTNESGAVRLTKMHAIWTLALQIALAPFFVQIVPLELNDLWPSSKWGTRWGTNGAVVGADGFGEESSVSLSSTRSMYAFFQIPMVKRAFIALCTVGYTILAANIFYSRLCGDLAWRHFVFFGWTLLRVVDERRARPNVMDLIINVSLVMASAMRCILILQRESEPSPALSAISGITDTPLSGAPETAPVALMHPHDFWSWLQGLYPEWHLRPDRHWLSEYENDVHEATSGEGDFGFVDQCPWSLEIELMRIFAAIGLLALGIRMVEFLTLSRDTGMLVTCIERMFAGNLLT